MRHKNGIDFRLNRWALKIFVFFIAHELAISSMSIAQELDPIRKPQRMEAVYHISAGNIRELGECGEAPRAVDVKRIFDFAGASVALFFFVPTMIAIYVALLISGGSPIFGHARIGKNGKPFRCYKFRSMVKNSDEVLAEYLIANPAAQREWDLTAKLTRDPRISRFGSFLRRSSLDELPQLFNVLKGDMSLVGPRPIVASEVGRYADRIEAYYRCKPGITGLWQVSGRNDVTYTRRVRLDTVYSRKRSMRLDVVILLRTIRAVASGRGAY